jgi:predicted nucleic acid-binding protein
MIVVDTNILIYYFVDSEYSETAVQIHRKDPVWVAPFLWRSEFRNTLLLYLRKKLLTLPQILRLIQTAESKMRDYEFHVLADEVFRLASVSTRSAYDCEFVALAKELGVPLVTADKQILHDFPETAVSPQKFVDG